MNLKQTSLIIGCAIITVFSFAKAQEPGTAQGQALLKTDLMAVLAHPDDETGLATTLAYYAQAESKTVACVYATRGEGGGNMVGTQWGPSLGVLREVELQDCLQTLGVRFYRFLDQLDWAYTESAAMTLEKWDREGALEKLVRYIRSMRPEVILTMNPTPRPGQHGHHQAAGILAMEAFAAGADPSRFPHQLNREGLGVWQTKRLFVRGDTGDQIAVIDGSAKLDSGKTPAEIAGEALSHHRSQGFGRMRGATWLRRPQSFVVVRSATAMEKGHSESLFSDFSGAIHNAEPRKTKAQHAESHFRFAGRPAAENFRQWAKQNGAGFLTQNLKADIPVIVGRETKLTLLGTRGGSPLKLEGPENWIIKTLPPDSAEPGSALISVSPAPGATEDVELIATSVDPQGKNHKAIVVLHPVPLIAVDLMENEPALENDSDNDNDWPDQWHPISAIAQGRKDNDDDCSARFRIVATKTSLAVEVEVRDDVLVSNIAPNDIRGHWRTDSVEICIDPSGGAQHTLGCLKFGVFPFDKTGRVRGARDADARQGLVEETAPGLQLGSERLRTGYRIRAIIPWALVGDLPKQDIAFNVIVYDGDKADAAEGENIGETRLAWSARPGVQGRPEDWGRVTVKGPQ